MWPSMAFCINHRQTLFALSSGHAHSREESYTAVCVQRERQTDRQRQRESKDRQRVKGQREREIILTLRPLLLLPELDRCSFQLKALIYTSFNLELDIWHHYHFRCIIWLLYFRQLTTYNKMQAAFNLTPELS